MPLYQDDATRVAVAQRCMWIFAMFTVMCIYGIWSEHRRIGHNTDIAIHSASTTGIVSYVHTGKGGNWFGYRYGVGDNYYDGKANGYPPGGNLHATGTSIKVTYSTTHPQWSVAGDIEEQSGSHAAGLLLAGLICATITFTAYRFVKRGNVVGSSF